MSKERRSEKLSWEEKVNRITEMTDPDLQLEETLKLAQTEHQTCIRLMNEKKQLPSSSEWQTLRLKQQEMQSTIHRLTSLNEKLNEENKALSSNAGVGKIKTDLQDKIRKYEIEEKELQEEYAIKRAELDLTLSENEQRIQKEARKLTEKYRAERDKARLGEQAARSAQEKAEEEARIARSNYNKSNIDAVNAALAKIDVANEERDNAIANMKRTEAEFKRKTTELEKRTDDEVKRLRSKAMAIETVDKAAKGVNRYENRIWQIGFLIVSVILALKSNVIKYDVIAVWNQIKGFFVSLINSIRYPSRLIISAGKLFQMDATNIPEWAPTAVSVLVIILMLLLILAVVIFFFGKFQLYEDEKCAPFTYLVIDNWNDTETNISVILLALFVAAADFIKSRVPFNLILLYVVAWAVLRLGVFLIGKRYDYYKENFSNDSQSMKRNVTADLIIAAVLIGVPVIVGLLFSGVAGIISFVFILLIFLAEKGRG